MRKAFYSFVYFILQVMTAMVGYTIHHSLFWSIMDFLFMPFAIVKWLICHQLTLTVLKETFKFLST